MIHIQTQDFYERHTGDRHEITVMFEYTNRKRYEVRVDGEFYSDHDSKAEVFEELIDIIKTNNWAAICPV